MHRDRHGRHVYCPRRRRLPADKIEYENRFLLCLLFLVSTVRNRACSSDNDEEHGTYFLKELEIPYGIASSNESKICTSVRTRVVIVRRLVMQFWVFGSIMITYVGRGSASLRDATRPTRRDKVVLGLLGIICTIKVRVPRDGVDHVPGYGTPPVISVIPSVP